MRRGIFLLAVTLLASLSVKAQLSGTGTITSPYSGTLTANLTITGTKYFGGNIVVDNETLTLSAGAKFISTATGACIKITGTGKIYAVGTAASPILISADIDKDLVNGEAGDTWGNIYITTTGISTLSYCNIENGTRLIDKLGSMGGGLYISSTGVTMTNCIVRNCKAIRGGGIYIASGHSPIISSTLLQNNNATENGGAVYLSATASPVISNVIFNGNSSNSSTLKGGAIASMSSTARMINCTVVNSSSAAADGKSFYLENSPSVVIVNTIIWGGSGHIALSGTASSVFTNCAIEGLSYPNCITLNSTNNDIAGPNFINPVAGDFSISFESPCRDAGVNSFAGVTIPATDYIGTKRVGVTDIGAYEMLYSLWTGTATTDWGRPINWDKSYTPGTTRNVVIPSGRTNYPVLSPGPSFTLSSGLKMIIEAGAKVSFNALTNNGTIIIKSNQTTSGSVIANSYSGSAGSLTVQKYITGGAAAADKYRWHYIAPPATVDKSVLTAIDPYNLLMYDETKVTTNMFSGWQWHDGYDGTTAFSTLNAKNGYDFFCKRDTTVSFSGLKEMTCSLDQINLSFSGSGANDSSRFGMNLIGNSLTCGINWDLVTRSDETHVLNAIYITKDDSIATYVDGVSTFGATAHIAPLQGFFVKTQALGTSVTIPNTAKEHNTASLLKSSSLLKLLRLNLTTADNKHSDETVIRLENRASLKFDGNYDAYKLFPPKGNSPYIYTSLNADIYSINSLPWDGSQTVVPVVLQIPASGTFTISRTELRNFGDAKPWLTDKLTNTTIDLSAVPDYSFTSDAGTISGRFLITISTSYPSAYNPVSAKSFNTYQSGDHICLIPVGDEWNGSSCTVRIYNLSGKVLLEANDQSLFNGEQKEYYPHEPNGILIVEVSTGGLKQTHKIVYNP